MRADSGDWYSAVRRVLAGWLTVGTIAPPLAASGRVVAARGRNIANGQGAVNPMRNAFPRLRRLIDVVTALPGKVAWPTRQPILVPVPVRSDPTRRRR